MKLKRKSRLYISIIVVQAIIILMLIGGFFYFKENRISKNENPSISTSEYPFGIDISHYQGEIDWEEVQTSHHPIRFVFVRATMGSNGLDKHFNRNWINVKAYNYIRGAYHYYRPNENSTEQFENFKAVVQLEKGDLFPVLDVEKESKFGRDNLREGVLNWLQLAEAEYGCKPIIYTGLKFYQHVLKGYVDDYPLWIAAYSGKHRVKDVDWSFHQFTDAVRVNGIESTVDGNDFNGNPSELENYRLSK